MGRRGHLEVHYLGGPLSLAGTCTGRSIQPACLDSNSSPATHRCNLRTLDGTALDVPSRRDWTPRQTHACAIAAAGHKGQHICCILLQREGATQRMARCPHRTQDTNVVGPALPAPQRPDHSRAVPVESTPRRQPCLSPPTKKHDYQSTSPLLSAQPSAQLVCQWQAGPPVYTREGR